VGQFPEKEWLDGPSFFRLSALPTTNPEYPMSGSEQAISSLLGFMRPALVSPAALSTSD
jgi:hypothetical protein